MAAWGIDGCRRGWLAVRFDKEARHSFEIFNDTTPIAGLDASMVFIDMPIGLPDTGYRGCDQAARRLLKGIKGAEARVFLGLRRPLLNYLTDYSKANAWAKADGSGLSKQAFAILPKIAAIDALMDPTRQKSFRESHPEIVFCRLNGGTPLQSKHTSDGIRARRDLLMQLGFVEIDTWLATLRGSGAKPDDLIDACVLAFAAEQATRGHSYRVKCPLVTDAKGLRMDIWF